MRMSAITAFSIVVTLSYCGTAKVEGYDCPAPNELLAGVSMRCGPQQIVGTLVAVPPLDRCSKSGQLDCVATGTFSAIDLSELKPENIKAGVTIAGTVGEYKPPTAAASIEDCGYDGQQGCVTSVEFPALAIVGLETKIAAGEIVGGVSGIATLNPPAHCFKNGQVGCLAVSSYPAVADYKFAECFLDGAP